MRKVSVVIPVHNEEEILERNLKKIESYLKSIKAGYEIIVVNNGSSDSTGIILKKLAGKRIRGFELPYAAFGEAIKVGMLKAKYDVVIYSIDLGFDINFIGSAISALENRDAVLGNRYSRAARINRSLLRNLLSRPYPFVANLVLGCRFHDYDAVKAFRNRPGKELAAMTRSKDNFFFTELLVFLKKSRYSFVEMPVSHMETRKSRFKIYKLVYQQLRDLLGKSLWLRGFRPGTS